MQIKEFSVREGLWDKTVKIAKVGKWRHQVVFTAEGNEASSLTFCNNCGSGMIIGVTSPGGDEQDFCATCKMPMPADS